MNTVHAPRRLLAIGGLSLLSLAGCKQAPPLEAPRPTGFLSDYSKLEELKPSSHAYIDLQRLAEYRRFFIEEVQVFFHEEARRRNASWSRLNDYTVFTHQQMRAAIEDAYTLTNRPGPGVAQQLRHQWGVGLLLAEFEVAGTAHKIVFKTVHIIALTGFESGFCGVGGHEFQSVPRSAA